MKHRSLKDFAVIFTIFSTSVIWCAPTRTFDILKESETRHPMDKRPKYMDTRRELNVFKDLVMLSIQKLVSEGSLSPDILLEAEPLKPVKKRARYMGICMRKQYNNFIPFPCLRNGR